MSELNDFISAQYDRDLKITESLATIAQSQKDMSARLFGDAGQKGMLTHMLEASTERAKERVLCKEKTDSRIGSLETWRKASKAWAAGAAAVITLEGTALGIYFNRIAGHIQTVVSLHK
jgi:hypothetical protein